MGLHGHRPVDRLEAIRGDLVEIHEKVEREAAMNRTLVEVAMCSLFLIAQLPMAFGAILDSDTIVSADNSFPNETLTIIDGVSGPTHVTVVDGGVVGGTTVAIDAYGSSVVKINGGKIFSGDGGIRLNVDARLQINGGAFDTLGFIAEGRDRSVIQIYDASIFEGVILFADSRLLYANRNTDFPRQPGDIRAAGHSVARIIEGDSSGWFVAEKNGRIVLNGPSAEGLHAFDNGRVDFLSGDIVSSLSATGNGAIHWRGGRLNQDEFVTVADNATVHFYGTNLRFETHPEFGDRVSGDLVNEPSFAVRYRLFDQGQIILHEVPEPTTLTLLAISTAGIWCARKRRLLR